MKQIKIILSKELEEKIALLAKLHQVSFSEMIRIILAKYRE